MWIIEHGRLISYKKTELTYIHKDQLIAIDPQGICQSLAIFCPETIKITKLARNQFWSIKTKKWILQIIKLNGIAMSLTQPIILAEIDTVATLYRKITQSDRKKNLFNSQPSMQKHLGFPSLDPLEG